MVGEGGDEVSWTQGVGVGISGVGHSGRARELTLPSGLGKTDGLASLV